MMRVTTANFYTESISNLQQRQGALSLSQQQLTSGKRVQHASDDPTAAARAERARAMLQRADASQRSIDASRTAMQLTESALGNSVELLQQARELMVAAGNASYSDAERRDVGNQLAEIRKQLMGVANRGDGSGGYVFSGQGASQPPFLDRPGGVAYVGVGGAVQTASDEALPLTLDGQQVWLSAPSGNGVFTTAPGVGSGAWIDAGRVTDPSQITGANYQVQFAQSGGVTTYSIFKDGVATPVSGAPYTSGTAIEIDGMAFNISGSPANGDNFNITPSKPDLSVFDAIDKAVQALKTPGMTSAQITQTVQTGLRDLDSVSNQLQSSRSMAGEVLNRVDGATSRVSDLKLFGETTRSNAEDLDMVQAISNFQNQQTGYQAALQTYSSLQRMSLFDYIKT
jgi:flagellar hook-associated protein 3 FlgL